MCFGQTRNCVSVSCQCPLPCAPSALHLTVSLKPCSSWSNLHIHVYLSSLVLAQKALKGFGTGTLEFLGGMEEKSVTRNSETYLPPKTKVTWADLCLKLLNVYLFPFRSTAHATPDLWSLGNKSVTDDEPTATATTTTSDHATTAGNSRGGTSSVSAGMKISVELLL